MLNGTAAQTRLDIRMVNPVDLRYVRATALSEDRKQYPLDPHANHFAAYADDGVFIGGASLAVVQWRRLGSKLVDVFGADPNGRVAWLYGVGVLPEHRGRGHAFEIVSHAMRLAAYSFARQFALVSRDPRLYERAGMQPVGERFAFPGHEALQVVPLVRELNVLELS